MSLVTGILLQIVVIPNNANFEGKSASFVLYKKRRVNYRKLFASFDDIIRKLSLVT